MLTIPENGIASTYKWLLLEHAPGSRIIIDSGSNGHHGIDAAELTQAFNMRAINVADNAGYSLVDRSRRILEFARRGDVVIMPIEWQGYSEPDGDAGYARLSLELVTEYFWAQTPIERARRILTTPFPIVARAFWRNIRKRGSWEPPLLTSEAVHAMALRHVEAMLYSSGTGGWANEVSQGVAKEALEAGCFRTTIGSRKETRSGRVREAFKLLRAAKENGVRVVITWPTVVGNDCYADETRVSQRAEQVRDLASQAGLEVIGNPADFWMPMSLADDSFYHVTQRGRSIITRRLIGLLRDAGLTPVAGAPPEKLIDTMSKEIFQIELTRAEALEPTIVPLDLDEFAAGGPGSSKIDYTAGWWPPEPRGRWARTNEVALRVRPKQPAQTLQFRLISAFEPRNVTVYINSFEAGKIAIDMARRDYEVNVPAAALDDPFWSIRLKGDDRPLMRPRDLGDSDRRSLTFFFEGLTLTGEAGRRDD
ncbi:hypothetical protein CO683_35130 [Bradyrhizobium ottawaense]|nr:hypothetical protein CO683_35130 [Bradyrhizobium ottawaense]